MLPSQTPACSRYFTVAMAGHVDHGKTSLIKRLTGIDPDRLKEEKERQMTTDLGFAHLLLPGGVGVGFIDVPGHGKFLKNMLAGVGGIDLALLVVAADEGPMPQTRQHAKILGLLGVEAVVLAITKVDLVNAQAVEESTGRARQLLAANGLAEAGCVHLSCTRGSGFEQLAAVLSRALELLPARAAEGTAFLPIDRVFTKSGHGTVVTGTLVRGSLAVGDQVAIEPGEMKARVRRLESLGQPVVKASAGQRVAANLVTRDVGELRRGHVLVAERVSAASSLIVSLSGLEERLPADLIPRLTGQDVRFYHGTAESHGHFRWLEPGNSSDLHAAPLLIAQLALVEPVVAEPGDRFVIRLGDETIYGGIILLRDRPRWLTRDRLRQLTPALLRADYAAAAAGLIALSPQRMVATASLDRLVPGHQGRAIAGEQTAHGKIVRLADQLLMHDAKESFRQRLIQELKECGQELVESGYLPAISLEHARRTLSAGFDRAAFQALVQEMIDGGDIIRRGDKLSLPGAAADSFADQRLRALIDGVEQMLSANLCLEITDLAERLDSTPKQVRLAVESLSKSGKAAVVAYDYASPSTGLSRAHAVLGELWKESGAIKPGEFRERLGTSRKYAMALLSYFDDQHVTRRVDNGRVLLKPPGT